MITQSNTKNTLLNCEKQLKKVASTSDKEVGIKNMLKTESRHQKAVLPLIFWIWVVQCLLNG